MYSAFFDFLRSGSLEWHSFAVTEGNRVDPVESRIVAANDFMLHCQCSYGEFGREDLYFSVNRERTGVNCRRVWTAGNKPCKLDELGFVISGIDFGCNASGDYYYHLENPRIYDLFTIPVDYDYTKGGVAGDTGFDEIAGTRWVDPGVICKRVGRSPYQPFPAILLSNYQTGSGLVHGTLSQDVFYHSYEVSHRSGKVELQIFSSFKAQPYLELESNRVLTDLWYLGFTPYADDFDRLFNGYTAELRKVLPVNYGKSDINRDNMVWGSWNDGIFRNVTEDLVLREARYLKENFPTVRWIQLDDGYAVLTPPANGLSVPYEGEDGVDHQKFPHGLRHYTDKIREIGLRPALWIGGLCSHKTKIWLEHPEWFCDYSYRIPYSSPLDVSLPEVREYMSHALDVLISEGGFEGVKHDFWSYVFEDSTPLLRRQDKSGYEYRAWWTHEIRKRLAPDGYMQTGCDIVMGNPFLGECFTNYRYGIDVSNGNWDYVKTNFLWGTACFGTHTGDLIVPNSDSIGLFKELPDMDARFLLDFVMITRTMVEIAGKLSYDTDHPRMKWLKKAACCVNNGQDVFTAGFDYRKAGRIVPEVFYLRSAQFSALEENAVLPLRTVGIFNCEEEAVREIAISLEELGLDPAKRFRAQDLWSHEEYAMDENGVMSFVLKPHQSIVVSITEDNGETVLLDADIQVSSAERKNGKLILSFGYDKQNAELRFNKELKQVYCGGKSLPFSICNGAAVIDLAGNEPVAFSF